MQRLSLGNYYRHVFADEVFLSTVRTHAIGGRMNQKNILAVLAMTSVLFTSCGNESINNDKPTPDRITNPKGDERVSALLSSRDLEDAEFANWHNLDLSKEGLFGVSTDKAYAELKLTQKREIIVAVIDSGVDYKHEDLKDVMWVNKGEIAGNGIDDDQNGYIDDIHGWNYLGGTDGRNINDETLEQTRIYKTMLDRLANGEVLNDAEDKLYIEVRDMVETESKKFGDMLAGAEADALMVKKFKAKLKELTDITIEDTRVSIESINSTDPEVIELKADMLKLWDKHGRSGYPRIQRVIYYAAYYAKTGYNVDHNDRAEISKDDTSDFSVINAENPINYGNNNVKGPDSSHGTHVAGIIAAKRDNNIGMNGVAGNTKIMSLRAVPNGDERDKDIALSVRYAADMGASIINMSFGKKFSPYKAQVDAAFKYAASKGVILIHAAGNDARNTDKGDHNYPNTYIEDGFGVLQVNSIPNWIEVGASTRFNSLDLVATFSNFGDEAITLFAPGHKIYSTTPENTYAAYNGTSMACPVTAGVAALLMSEFPTMTGFEAKDIILETVVKPELDIRKPDDNASNPDFRLPVPFRDLSQTDGVVNVLDAVKLAKRLLGN